MGDVMTIKKMCFKIVRDKNQKRLDSKKDRSIDFT